MLKYKNIKLKIAPRNYKLYQKYGPYKVGDIILIDVKDLSEYSSLKIVAICEICGVENEIKYYNYTKQIKRGEYYCCHKCSINKQKETMKNNGSEYFLSTSEYKNKMIELYGEDNPSKLEHIKIKRSNRLTDDEYQQKMIAGVISKYNVDNVSKLDFIKERKKKTCIKNYGVENPTQNEEIFIKAQKSGKKLIYHNNTGLYYRGTYEKDFLDYCSNNNIKVSKGKTIRFTYNNKNKVYYSDFFIESINLIIEIKSSYYYSKYLDLNKIKQLESEKQGYNYIIIIDKKYENFIYNLRIFEYSQ